MIAMASEATTLNGAVVVSLAAFLFLGSCLSFQGNDDTPVASTTGSAAGSAQIVQGVAGRIADSAGRPVAKASVQPKSLDNPSPAIPEIGVISDETGRYVWRLPTGNYEITVVAEGYRNATKRATVRRNQQTTLDFTLEQ